MSTTTDNFSSLFGGRLAEERKRLGLNQEEAGHACGVSREMWGKYERGRAVMGTEVLSRFGIAGADVLYILTGQRQGEPAAPVSPVQLDPDSRTAIEMAGDELCRQRKVVTGKTLLELVEAARRYIRQARELPGSGTTDAVSRTGNTRRVPQS